MKDGFYWKRGRRKRGRYNGPFGTLAECKAAAAKNGKGHDIVIGEMVWRPVPMPNAILVLGNVAGSLDDFFAGAGDAWWKNITMEQVADLRKMIDSALRAWMVANGIPNAIAVIEEVEVIKAESGEGKKP